MYSFNSSQPPRRTLPIALLSSSYDASPLSEVPVYFVERSVLKTGFMFQVRTLLFGGLMRTLNSLLAPSLFIIVAGIAFSFYSIPYYPHYDCYRKPLPYYPIQDSFVLSPVVIYPERALGVSLIVAGSVLVTLILTTQTALSHFNRHRSQAIRRTIPQGTC